MDIGNGIWKVVDETVTRMLWAARNELPNCPHAKVRISKANHSASTIIMPGNASRIMGPITKSEDISGDQCDDGASHTYPSWRKHVW